MSIVLRLAWLVFSAGVLASASAQGNYPTKLVHIIVPWSAGGPNDTFARVLGAKLTENLGQQVVTDNKPGAGGTIGADYVAKARPDGYALLMLTVGNHTITATLYSKLPYDAVRDFAPVGLTGSSPLMMVVHPSLPAKSVKEFIAYAKSKQGALNYGTPGVGTVAHLAGVLFNMMTGTKMVPVHYKGSAPSVIDLLSGQVSMSIVGLPVALPHTKAGKLTALGVTSPKRSAVAPDVPTVAESGLPGFEAEHLYGVLAPAGTPNEIVNKLNSEIVKIMQIPEVKKRFYDLGFDTFTSTPGQFAEYIKADIVKWAKTLKESGVTAN